MMRSISLVDFQSHKDTALQLGPLTVIVGSSSSGKSAVVRALRLVAQNARGTTYVRQGTKQARVTLGFGDEDAPWSVTVTRGKSVSEYELRPPSLDPMLFTKCSTSVPEHVTSSLGLGDPGLWLAGQFDRPYLLDETGSAVATVLGRLTNVTMIYASVRECNRRASETRRRVTERASELERVDTDLLRFSDLPDRMAAGQAAELALEAASDLMSSRGRLATLGDEAQDAEQRAARARSAVRPVPTVGELEDLAARRSRLIERLRDVGSASSRRAKVTASLRQVPVVADLDTLTTKRARLKEALRAVAEAGERRRRLAEAEERARTAFEEAKSLFGGALQSAGSCPLCGASAAHAQIDHVV